MSYKHFLGEQTLQLYNLLNYIILHNPLYRALYYYLSCCGIIFLRRCFLLFLQHKPPQLRVQRIPTNIDCNNFSHAKKQPIQGTQQYIHFGSPLL